MASDEYLKLDGDQLRRSFDHEAFEFAHRLGELELFDPRSLERLSDRYGGHPEDYFVARSASSAEAGFYAAPYGMYRPREALDRLRAGNCRLLLKRPERYDAGFRALMESILRQILGQFEPASAPGPLVRAESAIFVTSAATVTPAHFDPETAFFCQVRGRKNYHVYAPDSLDETDLERFYVGGKICIGQVDLAACDRRLERIFALAPGKGFHQPQNAPHWVETDDEISVSYTVVFETRAARARARVRAFNHYLRSLGVRAAPPGTHPARELCKAAIAEVALPARDVLKRALHRNEHPITTQPPAKVA